MLLRSYRVISAAFLLVLSLHGSYAVAASKDPVLSEETARELAARYYNTQGEWAGKFTVLRFLKSRFETPVNDQVKVHFEYEWAFLQRSDKTGIDSRYFVFAHQLDGWKVVEMGPHLSGHP
ncbi:hypothetical protein HDN1F_13340 [gamma proteobacterium HdN1]|nr:hypothetical protein HDN1F_13340 [gamma proteobacterium HdN1]